jgi:solute carrier family 25, member 39/40
MAIPANVIYFVGYDTLRTNLPSSIPSTLAPLIAGMFARTFAVAAISPLELFRTRLQAYQPSSNSASYKTVLKGVHSLVREQGLRSLWRGLELTLWRDVPFSGIYWSGYEYLRLKFSQYDVFQRRGGKGFFEEAFTAGWLSGTLAAFVTQPFDVSKTRRQVFVAKEEGTEVTSTMRLMGLIWREEGLRGLWKGFVPRMLKVAPACAIMYHPFCQVLITGYLRMSLERAFLKLRARFKRRLHGIYVIDNKFRFRNRFGVDSPSPPSLISYSG